MAFSQRTKNMEMYYTRKGRPFEDRDIHNEILDDGDFDGAKEISRAVALRLGLTPAEIASLYQEPKKTAKPKVGRTGRTGFTGKTGKTGLPDAIPEFEEAEHPRGTAGKFASKGGKVGGGGVKEVANVKLKKVTDRVFNGEPVPLRFKPSKQDTGKIGEEVALAYVRQIMEHDDARIYSLKAGEKAVDMIGDHKLIEVKAGLVSNSSGAQQWRATEGQPGKAETAWRKTASKEEIAELGEIRQKRIIERKQKLLRERSKQLAKQLEAATICTIINPDEKTADVFVFDGFHLRIGWKSDTMRTGYVGTFRYD